MKRLVAESLNEYLDIPKDEDVIPGEKKVGLTVDDVDPKEFLVGIEVEREHSDDLAVRRTIALQHLADNPKYYSEGMKDGIFDEPAAINVYKKYFIDKEEVDNEDIDDTDTENEEGSEDNKETNEFDDLDLSMNLDTE